MHLKGKGNALSSPEEALRCTLVPLEEAYLSRSRSRLLDPVNLMFVAQEAPLAKDEMDAFIKTITRSDIIIIIIFCHHYRHRQTPINERVRFQKNFVA